ncbi:uncharacterized protein Z519_05152 [Cladophialophora bantiana CBS 173.52]|uniref:Uncharacterized protein n=1 Tax=Cladophialophora bantiana (strain ATCC 10958 / CBS 173.52 / CDC B-1940 / NIH 8579) TaxID=1442370 RepID=A0A0D2G5C2_CLAB1|nr:uncharacterized protein Z519_05152 [Cladophialophora bantiana CBS 173.52]KIW93837.1 hypothetical protein Z519_05152 [Cladophialophora bantiana CBS 173.52]
MPCTPTGDARWMRGTINSSDAESHVLFLTVDRSPFSELGLVNIVGKDVRDLTGECAIDDIDCEQWSSHVQDGEVQAVFLPLIMYDGNRCVAVDTSCKGDHCNLMGVSQPIRPGAREDETRAQQNLEELQGRFDAERCSLRGEVDKGRRGRQRVERTLTPVRQQPELKISEGQRNLDLLKVNFCELAEFLEKLREELQYARSTL